MRDTFYAGPAPSRRQRLHLRAGAALEAVRSAGDAHAAELAHHYFAARHAGGAERALTYCLDAVQEASHVLAYEDAARQLERALEVLPLVAAAHD